MTLRQLPQSVEAEVALLGTLLVYPETTRTVAQYGLVPRDFYDAKHRLLFEAMMEVIESDVLLDVTTLIAKLNDKGIFNEVGGMEYLVHLTDGSGSPASLDYYVDIVQEKSQKRNLIETSQRIAEISFDGSTDVQELLDRAEKSIQEIAQSRRTEEMQKGPEVVDLVYQQIKDFGESGNRVTGLYTGYTALNNMTNGLQNGDLIILAARPSVGKTAFALNLGMNVSAMNKDGKASVAIFSLEMPATHLMTRMLSAHSGVDGTTLRNGKLDQDEWNRLNNSVGVMKTRNIYIDDSSTVTLSEMFAKCRKLKNEDKLDFVIVDYIQLISGRANAESRQQEVSEISRGLKQLARELEVPVLALSQLSRLVERREGNIPQLSDLRESGSIEQDADIVMFLYREAYHDQDSKSEERTTEESKLLIRKHRNGGLGDIPLVFAPKTNRFHSTSQREEEF